MRHLVAKTGGRYTYIEDFVALQDHSIALTSLFDGCNNFILSGCRTSGSNQNLTIAEGYVYINGKIRKFEGATVDLTNPFYIVESERSESVSYAQNATQQGCIYYECFGTTTLPTDKQYIKITSAYIPRLKDEFFGKYAMILDSSFSQQIVNKNLQLNGELNTKQKIVADGNLVIRDYDNSAMLTASQESGNIKLTYNNGVSDLSSISFGSDGTIRFTTANNEQVVITPTNTAVDKIRFNSALSSKLSIIGDEIENYQDSTDEAGINLNRSGYNYSASKPRNFNVFDGKGNLLFKTDGATKRSIFYGGVNEESNEEYGIILKSIATSIETFQILERVQPCSIILSINTSDT